MPESFKTFSDPLISLYQSAVTEIAKKIDKGAAAAPRSRAGLQRSMVSTLPGIAADIAEREYSRATGGVATAAPATPSPRELSTIGVAQVCAEWGWRYVKALAGSDARAIQQLEDEFTAGTCDPAWFSTLVEYGRFFENGKRRPIPYVRAPAVGPKTIEIKANSRIALMGDWGTGAIPAIEVLQGMADE